jgi:hypothetical protein
VPSELQLQLSGVVIVTAPTTIAYFTASATAMTTSVTGSVLLLQVSLLSPLLQKRKATAKLHAQQALCEIKCIALTT